MILKFSKVSTGFHHIKAIVGHCLLETAKSFDGVGGKEIMPGKDNGRPDKIKSKNAERPTRRDQMQLKRSLGPICWAGLDVNIYYHLLRVSEITS